MAEAFAVIGLVSAIAQFVDLSTRIIDRLIEFQSSLDDAPQTFRDLLVQLPLPRETLKRTKIDAEKGLIDVSTQQAVLEVVKGCQLQVERLDEILVKTLPAAGDSRLRRGVKAFKSVAQEKDVQNALGRIQQYQISLIHYHTTPARPLPVRRRPLFPVPFERDPRFIGRRDQINEIDKLFKIHRRVALAGLGGVGKSQIAIEYCYRYKESHPQASVLWIHTSNIERIDQAYKDAAEIAQLPGWEDPMKNKLDLVVNWLSHETGQWLMVLDNADDEDVFFGIGHDALSDSKEKSIARYIPHSKDGSVLITTRDRRVGQRLANRVQPIDILPFDPQDATDLFESLVGKANSDDEADIAQLLEILTYLPLAISQAAAFITENSMSVSEYLELLREGEVGMKELLSEELADSRRDEKTKNSVIRTWKISFDRMRRSMPRAAEMLSLASTLDRQEIPKSLLRRDNESSIEFAKAIGTLRAFSLITADQSPVNIAVHRLVHLATQRWLELEGEIKLWREEALKVVDENFPPGDFDVWPVCNALRPHVQAVVRYATDSKSCQLYAASVLGKELYYDLDQGRYDVALGKCKNVLETVKVILGAEHPQTLTEMANLSSIYYHRGQLAQAEALGVQVTDIKKRVLGAEHPETLSSMSNLALAYLDQGQLAKAEVLGLQVLEAKKRVLGIEHPSTLTSMANLAWVLKNQGRHEEAVEMFELAVELRRKVLTPEHPDCKNAETRLRNWQTERRGEGKEKKEK